MKFTKRLSLIALLTSTLVACMPYINTSPAERNYLWVDRYWLGYIQDDKTVTDKDGKEQIQKVATVKSNKQLAVAVIYEGAKKTGSEYTLYLATEKGLRFSIDNSNKRDLKGKTPSTTADFASQDVRNLWYDAKDNNGKAITAVWDIYDDQEHQVIFLSTAQGLYYKKYDADLFINGKANPAKENDNTIKFAKIENPSLKALDTKSKDFFNRTASNKPMTSQDIDGYAMDVQPIKLASGNTISVLFISTSTGLYFSTDLFSGNEIIANPNDAHWAHVVGACVLPMGNKDQDYPLATIKGAYKEFNEGTGQMEIKYKDKFYIGDEAWGNDDTNYDPIYDPIYDPTYNRYPDFYAESDGDYLDENDKPHHKVMGQPITWVQYAKRQGIDPDTNSYKTLSTAQKQAQQEMRHYYETVLELNDYGNPLNRETGVIRTYAYYRDKTIKATQIKGVSVYDDKVYLATVGGGISYADLSLLTKDLNSADPSSFEKEIIWETYTRNHFHYPALLQAVNDRAEENFWSLEDIWGKCIIANENGIFYGANSGGIHQASTYKSIRTVRDVNGLAMDYNGHTQCVLTKDSTFEFFNQYTYPQIKDHLLKSNPHATKDQIADLYYRADRDYHDGIDNENLVQGLRLNWKEYTTKGWSIYTAPGEVEPIRLPVLNFPSNQIQKIKFGKLGQKSMIYVATREGMGVAEVRKTYALEDYIKVPAEVTGEEQYNVDFVDWGAYNKDLTTLGEIDYIRDIDTTKDNTKGREGSDYYIYTATYGQGLVRYHWKAYDQAPFNLDLEELGLKEKEAK